MGAPATEPGDTSRLNEVHVHESGSPAAPTVVFVHGGGPGGAMWGEHLDRLAGAFHCLAPDLPGFGRSNRLAPISLNETADLVAELIVARVPARRAHVVGLSYGGSVVFALLDRHPEVLDRVVIDGACVLPGRADPLILAAVTLVSPIVNTPLAAAALRLIGWRDLGVALRSASPAAFRRSWKEGYTAPISRAALEAVCPTLLVAGEREHARASNAALAALMPHATARFVPGLGHAWFVWRRELHIRLVEAWLAGTDLPAELQPEPPSRSAAERVLRELQRQGKVIRTIGLVGKRARGEIPSSHRDLVECPPGLVLHPRVGQVLVPAARISFVEAAAPFFLLWVGLAARALHLTSQGRMDHGIAQ
jgi:pimeloyl-ACP methyl ester carboxylesterase